MDELKKEISSILARALAGYRDDYKIKHTDNRTYVAWGAVERDKGQSQTPQVTPAAIAPKDAHEPVASSGRNLGLNYE